MVATICDDGSRESLPSKQRGNREGRHLASLSVVHKGPKRHRLIGAEMSVFSQISRLERRAERWPRRFLMFAVVLFAGCFGPWLSIHFTHLWRREHYQFFPMLLLAVVGLSHESWRNAKQQGQSFETLKFGTPLFILSALTFSAALWLSSPWLAFLTTITVLWAVFRNVPFA